MYGAVNEFQNYTQRISFWYPLGITVIFLIFFLNVGISPKNRKCLLSAQRVTMLGKVPSQYTWKFLLGFFFPQIGLQVLGHWLCGQGLYRV
jgi:uncharacterized membrane protein YhaH (DUF805 family)